MSWCSCKNLFWWALQYKKHHLVGKTKTKQSKYWLFFLQNFPSANKTGMQSFRPIGIKIGITEYCLVGFPCLRAEKNVYLREVESWCLQLKRSVTEANFSVFFFLCFFFKKSLSSDLTCITWVKSTLKPVLSCVLIFKNTLETPTVFMIMFMIIFVLPSDREKSYVIVSKAGCYLYW